MKNLSKRRGARVGAVLGMLTIIVVFAYAVYLANLGGYLPWQEDPTPIASGITPFADIPGFNPPTTVPTATAILGTPGP